ncbi:hypothetical protein C3374_13520 [Pantoea sp. PSNIH4]|nr:hypothetical protein C3374_13520 [Pantoea sp. PSNIH4]POY67978.1 hypothetical protein C3402_09440 [Pantoea sp. PSNIH3]
MRAALSRRAPGWRWRCRRHADQPVDGLPHQHISTSAHQHISTSAHQHISTSAHQRSLTDRSTTNFLLEAISVQLPNSFFILR